jgi:cell division septum initiation protein DivIVA
MTKAPVTGEAELFAQGLDQYLATGELTTLNLLSKQYPQGEWRARADGLIEMAKQQQQQHAQDQKNNQGLSQCQAEKHLLVEDNKILEATLERLKQVLIDTELKGN